MINIILYVYGFFYLVDSVYTILNKSARIKAEVHKDAKLMDATEQIQAKATKYQKITGALNLGWIILGCFSHFWMYFLASMCNTVITIIVALFSEKQHSKPLLVVSNIVSIIIAIITMYHLHWEIWSNL